MPALTTTLEQDILDRNWKNILTRLDKEGLDPNIELPGSTTLSTQTLLKLAVQHGNSEMVFELLNHGADPCKGYLLNFAVSMTRINNDIIEMLIVAGADVDAVQETPSSFQWHHDNTTIKPLMSACYHHHYTAVTRLLEAGANPNIQPGEFKNIPRGQMVRGLQIHTPLTFAIKNQDSHLVQLLLIFGADKQLPDSNGKTPLEYAQEGWDLSIKQLLESYGTPLSASPRLNTR